MKLFSDRALAILNMLIFCVIFTVLSGVILALVSSHTRQMETNIRRTKAFYVSEAGNVASYDSFRRNVAFSNPSVEWSFNAAGNPTATKPAAVVSTAGAGPGGTTRINSTTNYVMNW
ncbi:MAG TPA: hypothetical protein DCL35_03705 [Candidatus Omnitrophica bacterium]|nr:hypothetical protein [Candidatus Omnitrophota bacterium]